MICDNKDCRKCLRSNYILLAGTHNFHQKGTTTDMSDNQNWSNMGDRIKGALSEALQSGDFNELNHLVTQAVTNSLKDAGINISKNWDPDHEPTDDPSNGNRGQSAQRQQREQEAERRRQAQEQEAERRRRAQEQEAERRRRAQEQEAERQRRQREEAERQRQRQALKQMPRRRNLNLPAVRFNKTGNVSNVLYQVFGGIGLGITGIAAFIHLLLFNAGTVNTVGSVINLIFLVIFFGMVRLGIGQRKRLKRAARYMALCADKMFGELEDLARDTGKSKRYVTKDLQKMLALGMFPEGHLDEQMTCFMLNDTVYRQYLDAENSRKIREAEEKKALAQKSEKQPDRQAPNMQQEQETELNAMISEGMECIRKLRDLNDQIPGEAISAKLFRLEGLLKDIFDGLQDHPEQMHRMHKLMDYYLPTTLKLVEAYADFDRISAPGEEIISAKAEIENTLDTINRAFTELLNNLFQNAVFDATTDAQVLKTMLAREGLTKEMAFSTTRP